MHLLAVLALVWGDAAIRILHVELLVRSRLEPWKLSLVDRVDNALSLCPAFLVLDHDVVGSKISLCRI